VGPPRLADKSQPTVAHYIANNGDMPAQVGIQNPMLVPLLPATVHVFPNIVPWGLLATHRFHLTTEHIEITIAIEIADIQAVDAPRRGSLPGVKIW